MKQSFEIEFTLDTRYLHNIRTYFLLKSFAKDGDPIAKSACEHVASILTRERFLNHPSERSRFLEHKMKDSFYEAERSVYREAYGLCKIAIG